MLEKEIKILDVDQEKVIQLLENLWAEKTFEWFVHDIYYDFIKEWKQKLYGKSRLFRVRTKWDSHLYTIKRKRNKNNWWEKWLKVADEAEKTITDIESFTWVLEKYWMKKIREKKKYRVSYKLWEVEFDFDKYEEIPTLLEIEAKTKEEIDYFIQVLWCEKNEKKSFWSRKLYKYYWKKYLYINQ